VADLTSVIKIRLKKMISRIPPFKVIKVIGTDADRSAIYDFLLVFYSNFEIFDFKNAVTLKTGLGVRQGHWKCHHSIERIRLPIDVL